MADNLLPCPFCGGEAYYLAVYAPPEKINDRWRVKCEKGCEVSGPVRLGKSKAAEAWNRRALPDDVAELVIAAREFWQANEDMSEESAALDKALEAFAGRVPYENEPEAPTKSNGGAE